MRQSLHILRKDLRHHWPEIAVSTVLLVAFCWYEIDAWNYPGAYEYGLVGGFFLNKRFLSRFIDFLLPISWFLLIVRAVHDESLVGHRQFWITRPYEWRSLLWAKLLLVVLAINLPLLIAQFFLLARGGFNPVRFIPGLLFIQLLLFAVLVASAFTLATLTRTLLQSVLAIAAVVLYLILAVSFDSLIPNSAFYSGSELMQEMIFAATVAAVIFLQYSRRRTRLSWCLTIGMGAAILSLLSLLPFRRLIDHEFPRLQAASAPLQLRLAAPSGDRTGAANQAKEVEFQLPLDISGQSPDSVLYIQGFRVMLVDSGREQWGSEWLQPGQMVVPGLKRTGFSFSIPKKTYDGLKSRKLTVRVAAAVLEYRDGNRRDAVLPDGVFPLQNAGRCIVDRQIKCHAPLRGPRFMLVRSDPAASTCPPPGWARNNPPETNSPAWSDVAWASLRDEDPSPASLELDPVTDLSLYFTLPGNAEYSGVCPGSRVTFSNPVYVRQFQTEWSWDSVRIADYRVPPMRVSIVR